MNKNLTCNQVEALINLYVEGKLSNTMVEYVELHINSCPHCKNKVEELKSILAKYQNDTNKTETDENSFNEEFINNLSAYVDNELNNNENIKIKKMTISNPNARKRLETMYRFKKLMLSAYEKTKSEYKADYSKTIMAQVLEQENYSTQCFHKLLILFCIIIIGIIAGFFYLYL